jgi:hypothetical protein
MEHNNDIMRRDNNIMEPNSISQECNIVSENKTKEKLTVFGLSFWDMWIQKCFRNFASVKYQWMIILYVPVVWGMFNICESTKQPWVSAALGLGFLGGGFITLSLGRIVARTQLTEDNENYQTLDTDR